MRLGPIVFGSIVSGPVLSRAFAALVLLAGVAAADGERRISAAYDVYLGGLRVGELALEARVTARDYAARGSFRTVGLIALFDATELYVEVAGRLDGMGPTPLRFTSRKVEDGRERVVRIAYAADGSPAVEVAPPFRDKPWSLDPATQRDTVDPLTALVTVLAPADGVAPCGRRIEVFDGRYRFAFDLGPPEESGGELICRGTYLRLAGFSPSKMKSRNARIPLKLTFERRADGSLRAARIDATTRFGRAVVRLRE